MDYLEAGTEVKYKKGLRWRKGVVHGIVKHETPEGQITHAYYLIDTGTTLAVHAGVNAKGKLEKTRQPEQLRRKIESVKPV